MGLQQIGRPNLVSTSTTTAARTVTSTSQGVRQRVGGPTRVVLPTQTTTAAAVPSASGATTYMLQATPNVVRTETVQTTTPNGTNATTESPSNSSSSSSSDSDSDSSTDS